MTEGSAGPATNEIYKGKVSAGRGRCYFINVKKTVEGWPYLVIIDSRKREDQEGWEHTTVLVFHEYWNAFHNELLKAMKAADGVTGEKK